MREMVAVLVAVASMVGCAGKADVRARRTALTDAVTALQTEHPGLEVAVFQMQDGSVQFAGVGTDGALTLRGVPMEAVAIVHSHPRTTQDSRRGCSPADHKAALVLEHGSVKLYAYDMKERKLDLCRATRAVAGR